MSHRSSPADDWLLRRAARRNSVIEFAALSTGSAAFFMLFAWLLGQDSSWDLQNYHLYNPHALVTGRLFWDIQPAMRQTYVNPLLDVPFYLVATSVSPLAASLALAAFQSLLLVLAYYVARRILAQANPSAPWSARRGLALALALAGVLAPLSIYEIGYTAGDNTTAVLVLGALLVLLHLVTARDAVPARHAALYGLASGLLAGAAVGLKLTNASYAVAIVAALWLTRAPRQRTLTATAGYAAGGIVALAGTAGFWWWTLYAELGNPLFPQMNQVFRSPWIYPDPFTDETFKAKGWLRRLFYPFVYNELTGGRILWQRFMDARLPVLYVLTVGWGFAAAWRWLRRRQANSPSPLIGTGVGHAYLAWCIVVAYLLWLLVFSIDRYILLLEVLAPIAAWSLLWLIGLRRRGLVLAGTAVVLVFAFTYHSVPAQRSAWSDDLFGVRLPPGQDFSHALVLMGGEQPLAYVVPTFPRSTRFVRFDGNLFYGKSYDHLAARYDNETGRAIQRAIEEHTGPLYLMVRPAEWESTLRVARHFGVTVDPSYYAELESRVEREPIRIYPVRTHAFTR